MISGNQISAHATDTAALAACVSAASCYGISYLAENSASTRWSARLGGAGVSLFTLSGIDSWVYSGSCNRRLAEDWADESTSPAQPVGFFRRLAQEIASVPDDRLPVSAGLLNLVPDPDERPLAVRPAHGPLLNMPTDDRA